MKVEVTFFAGETVVNAAFETEDMFKAVHKRTMLHDELVEALRVLIQVAPHHQDLIWAYELLKKAEGQA